MLEIQANLTKTVSKVKLSENLFEGIELGDTVRIEKKIAMALFLEKSN